MLWSSNCGKPRLRAYTFDIPPWRKRAFSARATSSMLILRTHWLTPSYVTGLLMNHWYECLAIWYGISYRQGDKQQGNLNYCQQQIFELKIKRERQKNKTPQSPMNQVSDTAPLGLLFYDIVKKMSSHFRYVLWCKYKQTKKRRFCFM